MKAVEVALIRMSGKVKIYLPNQIRPLLSPEPIDRFKLHFATRDFRKLLKRHCCLMLSLFASVPYSVTVLAQGATAKGPSVGVVKAHQQPITEVNEFIGRIEAPNRVNIVARITAYLNKIDFKDGAEVRKGDLLYELERPPFQADLDAKQAIADQYQAQLTNARLSEQRARSLLQSNAGAQATVDSTTAAEKALAAQLLGAKANVEFSQINLDYTRIASTLR